MRKTKLMYWLGVLVLMPCMVNWQNDILSVVATIAMLVIFLKAATHAWGLANRTYQTSDGEKMGTWFLNCTMVATLLFSGGMGTLLMLDCLDAFEAVHWIWRRLLAAVVGAPFIVFPPAYVMFSVRYDYLRRKATEEITDVYE